MIEEAESELEAISNPQKKKQPAEKIKKEFLPVIDKKPPAIEKKPPVPSNNRAKEPQSFVPHPNYHYRNKNEVTGKITQMPSVQATRKAPTVKVERNIKGASSV